MATIYVDDQPCEVDPSQNLLAACLGLGLDLPYFCWHPAMGSVGACRQCAVKQFKDQNDTRGKIVMACMTPAAEGTRISIQDPEAVEFRAKVIEWLMLNHPHDCPVCDEGGECHLQDMTVMTGHVYRRTRFPKRTHRNQYLGPFVNHEMNRCIQCYRCVRFYCEYAGGKDFNVFGAHDAVYFGRHTEGVLENEFSGNLVEVCPTGVFTDKTLRRHYTRKWDLEFAPSICPHCGLGCNVSPGARYGTLRRIVNRYHHQVNGYFICDRGRFGYEFVNHHRRLRHPSVRGSEADPQKALGEAGRVLAGAHRVVGIGSPRASLESNFALCELVGAENFSHGLSQSEALMVAEAWHILERGPAPAASVRDLEVSDAVLVLGEDLTNTAPRAALALRRAVRNQPLEAASKLRIPLWHDHALRNAIQDDKGAFYVMTPGPTKLDELATHAWRAAPADIARMGLAVAHAIDRGAPSVPDLPARVHLQAERVGQELKAANHPVVVTGISTGELSVLRAAANVVWALNRSGRAARILINLPESNTLGVFLLSQRSIEDVLGAANEEQRIAAIVLENDLGRRMSAPEFLRLSPRVSWVAIDCYQNPTTDRAEVVLPSGTFAESSGTLVSSEGRAQRFFRVLSGAESQPDAWRWLGELMTALGRAEVSPWQKLDDVIQRMSQAVPALGRVPMAAPKAELRLARERVPREPPRYSGRTAMHAHLDVHEPQPPEDPDSALSFSMEGYPLTPPPALTPYHWVPAWNSIQSQNRYQQTPGGALRGASPGVRLLDTEAEGGPTYYAEVPPPFSDAFPRFLLLGAAHLFGSDELSSLAPGIAERIPGPYVALHPDELQRLGTEPGRDVEIALPDGTLRVPARAEPSLPPGIALLPIGLPSLPWIGLPAQAAIRGV